MGALLALASGFSVKDRTRHSTLRRATASLNRGSEQRCRQSFDEANRLMRQEGESLIKSRHGEPERRVCSSAQMDLLDTGVGEGQGVLSLSSAK